MACMHIIGTWCQECRPDIPGPGSSTSSFPAGVDADVYVEMPRSERHARAMIAIATAYLKDMAGDK